MKAEEENALHTQDNDDGWIDWYVVEETYSTSNLGGLLLILEIL